MEFLTETRFIERLQFFNGQRLLASDLQGLEAFHREMRWLHNQSLHQPGIGNGFAVSGAKGAREVTIGPGYAIDAEGREIVLTRSQSEPVPPVAGRDDGSPALYDLTVSYPEDAFLEETERREGICDQPGGAIRLKEEPVFCWIELSEDGQPIDVRRKQEILAGARIVLARARVRNCRLNEDITIAQRLSARPPKQPYVCCGVATPRWRPWIIAPVQAGGQVSSSPFILPFGLEADIDTKECGFLTAPCYWARIAGPRLKQLASGEDDAGRVTVPFLVDGLVQVVNPLPDEFRVQVLLLIQIVFGQLQPAVAAPLRAKRRKKTSRPPTQKAPWAKLQAAEADETIRQFVEETFQDWSLVWMGVEG
jgi:hypothetical protein